MRAARQGRLIRPVPGSRTVVIAGAGIGGLTAALALAARGFDVTILEKAEQLQEAGAGLQLSPNASRVLIGLGLRDRLAAHAVTPAAIRIMTARSGGELVRLPLGDAASGQAGAPYWVMHRADLQAALLDAATKHPNVELRLGCAVEDVAIAACGVTVGAHGAAALQAQALIGADGVWSRVRHILFPQTKAAFAGLIAWRGTFDADLLPGTSASRAVQLWMGPNGHLVAYPMSGGRQVNMVAIVPGDVREPGWSAPGDASELTPHFSTAGWPAEALAMLGAVTKWQRWALFTLPDGGIWNAGPVALLGDAAHAMLPFAAQGAGMAIEDAAVLAACLGEAGHDAAGIPAALQRYADLRRARVGRVQRTARQSGKIYHLHGPMALARDLVMQALGPRRLQARQDWIYDWTP
jgi:salicylate hydroxylase